MEKNNNIQFWFRHNKHLLEHLYHYLINLCNKNKIKLIHSKELANNFIIMMYNESLKNIINKELYPEFFYIEYNSPGYKDYKIIEN